MPTLPRPAAIALLAALALFGAACGSSDADTSSASDDGPAATGAPAGGGEAPATSGDGGVPSADGALDLTDFRAGEGQDDLDDATELLMATSVLGDVDGYVTTDDQLVVRGDDGETLQYLCIAKDQLTLDTYTVVVLQQDGTRADC